MRINVGTVNINLPGIPTTLDGSDRTRCQVKLKDSYRTEYGTAMNRSSGRSASQRLRKTVGGFYTPSFNPRKHGRATASSSKSSALVAATYRLR